MRALSFNVLSRGTLTLLLFVFCLTSTQAQPTMALVWKADHGFKPDYLKNYGPYGDYFVGMTKKQVSVIGGDGQLLWKYSFKDKFGISEINGAHLLGDAVIKFDIKPKNTDETDILVNAKTGEEVWRTGGDDKSKLDELMNNSIHKAIDNRILFASVPEKKNYGSRIISYPTTPFIWGDEVTSSVDVPDQGYKVTLSYTRKFLRSSYGKTTPVTITATKGETTLWSLDLDVKIVNTLVSDEDIIDFYVSQNKIVLVYQGVSVIDLSSGKLLWTSDFDNAEISVGLKAKQELNIADNPLVTQDGIYIVDLTSATYGIKKCALETGDLIWKSPKYSSSDVVPFITMQNGVLLAKFGGVINTQQIFINDNGTTYKSKYEFKGKAGIKAFDAQTGALIWDEKKLGDKIDVISDFILGDGTVSFFSDKAFYTLDTKTGLLKQKVPLKDLNVDNVIGVWTNDDNTIAYAVYDNGVFAVNIKDGKTIYESVIKDINGVFKRGDVYFAEIGEDRDKLIAFDILTGMTISKIDDAKRKNVTQDGQYVTTIDWGKIEKYKVK
jgi:hypothetical protein